MKKIFAILLFLLYLAGAGNAQSPSTLIGNLTYGDMGDTYSADGVGIYLAQAFMTGNNTKQLYSITL